MKNEDNLKNYMPKGIVHEVGELTVLHDGQRLHYHSALLITFEDIASLQDALELKHCAYYFEYELVNKKH